MIPDEAVLKGTVRAFDRDVRAGMPERMRRIESSGIRRVFELGRSLKDPVNLSIGQPHFDVPEPIKAAARCVITYEGIVSR